MNAKATPSLNPRQKEFAALVASGMSHTDAYARAYSKPNGNRQFLAERGCKLAAKPLVAAEIARLREKSDGKKLLTLNDRLSLLARIAQKKTARPVDVTRAIEVYSRISGDEAPQRHEVSAPGGGPIEQTIAVSVTNLPIRTRIAALRAARDRLTKTDGNPA